MPWNAAYTALMHETCVGLGFCGSTVDGEPRHVNDYIPESGVVTADQFADWTLIAEGMDPETSPRWRRVLSESFVRHMGSETADAEALHWLSD